MSSPSISTPCPAPSRVSAHRLSALPSFDEQDDTSQIEYTRVIQREFAHARPRRPARRDAGPRVFEDVVEGEEMRTFQKKDESAPRGTLLGKRPSRRVPMASMAQGRSNVAPADETRDHDHGALAGKDRIAKLDDDKARKDSRRRTIYVPTDDTTLMTIHPGANTTDRLEDTFQLPAYKPQSLVECASRSPPVTDQPQQSLPTKKPRLSLAAAPRRAPLGQIEAKSLNLPAVDVVGDGGGKENTPPKFGAMEKPFAKETTLKGSELSKQQHAKSKLFEPTAASQSRQTMQSRKSMPMTKARPSPNVSSAVNAARSRLIEARGTSRSVANRATAERPNKESPPTRKALPPKPWKTKTNFVTAADVSKAKLQRYHALNEDVSRPDLYEENWLDQQEVALTEVINHIFSSAEPITFDDCMGKRSLRESLLEVYDQPHVATLHKRLQASLCYGALSKPKDMPTAPDLTHDLGLRRRFLQLWLDSYKMEVLCAAAEVVVGRKIPTSESMSGHAGSPGSDTKSIDPKHSRREIIGFLETFFVTVEDVEEARSSDEQVQTQRRNKTVLRSLMLVWLLDQAATSGLQSERLFKVKSAHKTSASVLNALAGMLVPSIGDMGRVMRHMEFVVSYVQDPLDEVSYHIDNLAVDLRDGILLTKLVELLLYQTSSKVWDRLDSADETLTIVMPDATVLESALYNNDGSQQSRILSQHLKMPCIGHAQKVYNVDIALQALDSHPRTSQAVASSITAETIVDGHRENTLNLLWSLVSSIGLDVLLSKEDLVEDIARLDPTTSDLSTFTTDVLLQGWAAAYCAPNGVKVSNLTTSFATDAPYSAIVAAFSDFFSPTDARASLGDTNTASRLRFLGCSEAFVKQLTSSTTSIPTRQTTLANLAFLASRLLPLAKRFHAAVTIQRAFRVRHGWTILRQRVALMKMAAGCADVVRERQRFVTATLLVQRTWRNIVQGRVTRLDDDVLSFQSLARAWVERRRIVASKRSGLGHGRRMVGW